MNRPQTLGYDGLYIIDKVPTAEPDTVIIIRCGMEPTPRSKHIEKTWTFLHNDRTMRRHLYLNSKYAKNNGNL